MLRVILLIMLISSACGYPKPENNLKVVKNNGLSSAEKSLGWKSLFNGKNITAWRVYGEEGMRGWKVENGEMVALGLATGHADIISNETFTDFELKLEWNISNQGNSGIFFNVREGDDLGAVYYTGPEYQLLDDAGLEGKLNRNQQSGANYDMHPPRLMTIRPAGEWNQSRLIVEKGHVQHWLNGKKVVEYDLWTSEWEEMKEKSKWKNFPQYGAFKSGHLALQDHGNQIRFRNIKVRRL